MNPMLKIIIPVVIGIFVIISAIVIPVAITQSNKTNNGTSTATSSGSDSYLPYSGVQRNFFPTSLPSGWSICHVSTYDRNLSSSNLPSMLSSCYKSKLLLGCRTTGTTMLTVAAMGDRSDVLYNCGSTTNCRNVANGVGWYYSTIYSWGFANGSDSVNRNPCDLSGTNPNYRLCWLTNGGGGYRCGSTTGLTSSTSYEKVIYHSA